MLFFSGSLWSNTQQIIKHVFTGVVDIIEDIFLRILIWHTNSIPFARYTLRSVCKQGHCSWRPKYGFPSVSDTIGRIFLKIPICHTNEIPFTHTVLVINK